MQSFFVRSWIFWEKSCRFEKVFTTTIFKPTGNNYEKKLPAFFNSIISFIYNTYSVSFLKYFFQFKFFIFWTQITYISFFYIKIILIWQVTIVYRFSLLFKVYFIKYSSKTRIKVMIFLSLLLNRFILTHQIILIILIEINFYSNTSLNNNNIYVMFSLISF
jgi:hypothetical protein